MALVAVIFAVLGFRYWMLVLAGVSSAVVGTGLVPSKRSHRMAMPLTLLEGIGLITLPLRVGIALVSREFVLVFLGSKWAPAILPITLQHVSSGESRCPGPSSFGVLMPSLTGGFMMAAAVLSLKSFLPAHFSMGLRLALLVLAGTVAYIRVAGGLSYSRRHALKKAIGLLWNLGAGATAQSPLSNVLREPF